MYIPHDFKVEDRTVLFDLMQRFSFATLVSMQDGVPVASHLPFLVHPGNDGQGQLVAHMARANSQWKSFAAGQEVLVIFQGDHAYISPSWYSVHPSVPTWNYAVVHAYGVPHIIEDYDETMRILRELVNRHEGRFAAPWQMNLPADYEHKMIKGIVAFAIDLTRIEGKFKLSQNRNEADRNGVIAALEQEQGAYRGVAQLMKDFNKAAS